MRFFCPKCWAELEEDSEICPKCGFRFKDLSYEDKLIMALRHPVLEFKINAIRTLGRLKSKRAVREFERMVEEETVPIVLEIVEALARIGGEESRRLLEKLTKHRSKLVAKRAKEKLI